MSIGSQTPRCTCVPVTAAGVMVPDPHCPAHGTPKVTMTIKADPDPASALPATPLENSLGLSVDMLDVDRLRSWATLLEIHGNDISHWSERSFVIAWLREFADRLDTTIREVGILRQRSLPAGDGDSDAIRALLGKWREMAVCDCGDIHCDCDASGYQACADQLDAALRRVPARPQHTCHDMNPPFPYECAACVEDRIDAALERAAEHLPADLSPAARPSGIPQDDGRSVVVINPEQDFVQQALRAGDPVAPSPWAEPSSVPAASGGAETERGLALMELLRGALMVAQRDLHNRHRPSFDVPIERCAGERCREAVLLSRSADDLNRQADHAVPAGSADERNKP